MKYICSSCGQEHESWPAITYNSPSQFEYLIDSFQKADINFISEPIKFLINNSTDTSTNDRYDVLCKKYNFIQIKMDNIKMDNIGICSGRQFVAEHFDKTGADYYICFGDDMLLHCPNNVINNNFCTNGFRKWVPDLYHKSLEIMHTEEYDFLKINFAEVYGGNEIQWAWYNIPDDVRHQYFPDKKTKPIHGLDPNPPPTLFTYIKQHNNITYIEGDIYYCNWPMWTNRTGNKKIFLEPKFAHPYEQTWMSMVFQKQKESLFKVAVLLLSPVNHHRIHYYPASERKEN